MFSDAGFPSVWAWLGCLFCVWFWRQPGVLPSIPPPPFLVLAELYLRKALVCTA